MADAEVSVREEFERSGGQPPLLELARVSKSFPGVRALDEVGFSVDRGELVAIVGQNGCGKSTLVKVLAGVYSVEPGATCRVDGVEVPMPCEGRVHFIHQDLGLIDALSTVENLDLTRPLGSRGWKPFRGGAEARRAEELIAQFGANFDVMRPVSSLSPAERTIVAIARALQDWDRPDNVLVLDEPTAALHGDEVDKLMRAIRRVAARDGAVVFISHRLDEVINLAHRVIVMRDGKVVANRRGEKVDRAALVRLMIGEELATRAHTSRTPDSTVVLDVHGLRGHGLDGIDLCVRKGEIVGISGIMGSGRDVIARAIFAADNRGGVVEVEGRRLAWTGPRASILLGVAHLPADRRGQGAVMAMNVRENLTLPLLPTRALPLLRRLRVRLDHRRERDETSAWIDAVGVSPPMPERALGLFSGGNQQKVLIAKWLRTTPKVLLLDDPTQGVDVKAKAAIWDIIDRAAAQGAAVVVCSSDEDELVSLCDRVVVLRDGRIAADVPRQELTQARLMAEAIGVRSDFTGRHGGDSNAD